MIGDKLASAMQLYGNPSCINTAKALQTAAEKGVDIETIKSEMLEILDERGAEYPAEHNVGHLYAAKPNLADFYKSIDPTNSLNPGIGKLSKSKHYADT